MKRFGILFLLTTLMIFIIVACHPKTTPTPPKNWRLNKETALFLDDDIERWKKELSYRCDSDAGSFSVSKNDLKKCFASLHNKLRVRVPVQWNCPQSHKSSFNRSLTENRSFRINSDLTLDISGEIYDNPDLKEFSDFMKTANGSESGYQLCFEQFLQNYKWAITKKISERLKIQCKISPNVYSLYQAGEISRPSKSIALIKVELDDNFYNTKVPPILPLHDLETENFDKESCRDDCLDSINGYISKGLIPFYSRDFIENDFATYLKKSTGVTTPLRSILDFSTIPYSCLNSPYNKNCNKLLPFTREFYQIIDEQLGLQDEKMNFSNLLKNFPHNLTYEKKKEFREFFEDKFFPNKADPEKQICSDLTIGKKMGVQQKSNYTYQGGTYILERTSKNQYELSINVSFLPNCSVTPETNMKLVKRWFKRVNSCLKTMNPYMFGPNNKKVAIKLISTTENSYNIGNNSIKVLDTHPTEEFRAHSGLYSPGSSCGTILHEVLHLVGLVDEYFETDVDTNSPTNKKYNCRILGPEDSVMRKHWLALPQYKGEKRSVLKPAHFNYMIYPNCSEKNNDYYTCSSWAYSTGECKGQENLPRSCKNGSFDWINNP